METSSDENIHRTGAGVERHPFTNRSACCKDTFTFSVLGERFRIPHRSDQTELLYHGE